MDAGFLYLLLSNFLQTSHVSTITALYPLTFQDMPEDLFSCLSQARFNAHVFRVNSAFHLLPKSSKNDYSFPLKNDLVLDGQLISYAVIRGRL